MNENIDNTKKEEATLYNLYKTLKILLDKIKLQSGKELENVGIAYNQKLVEIGNKLQEKDLKFSMVTEFTNTVNHKMMSYIREASKWLDEYVKLMENEENRKKEPTKKSFFSKLFKNTSKQENDNIKANLALEKYDEMVCSLKLFKIEKDMPEAIEEYIKTNSSKGEEFIENYKTKMKEQMEKIGIENKN